MKKSALTIVLISIVMFTTGCAHYKVGDKTYHSRSEALKETTKILSYALDGITPTDTPVHGTILVLLPSDDEIHKRYYMNYTGNPSRISEEQIKYAITVIRSHFQFVADAIRKRGIFDSVSVAYQNGNPASFPIGDYDYLVFEDVDGWFLRARDNPKPFLLEPLSLALLENKPKQLLDSLQQQAKALRSN